MLFATLKESIANGAARSANQPGTWYEGAWMVTPFHRDGREVPASMNEPSRWSRVRFQTEGAKLWFRWRFVNSSTIGDLYDAVIDEQARTLTLAFNKEFNDIPQPKPGLGVVVLRYTRIDDPHLTLEGGVGTEHLSAQLEYADTSKMLLVTRGFHWINETPFNR